MADQRCPDCHVQPGQPHDLGCDMARCPACGTQRLRCSAHGGDRTLDARAVWTGAVPTVADNARCPHCADGHDDPHGKPWSVWVAPTQDGDGQPTTLHVAPSNSSHVAESDAEWLRGVLRGERGAESAIARVRELHGEIPYKRGSCYCANPYPCPTVRALDGEDTDRG